MGDFSPEEMMTLRVAIRSYMESMRTNAITFASDPDTGHYFASEAERAEELWNKLVQMDLNSIRAAREALAEAIADEERGDASGYYEEADSDEMRADQEASDSLPHPADAMAVLREYNDRMIKRQSSRSPWVDGLYRIHRHQDPEQRGGRP